MTTTSPEPPPRVSASDFDPDSYRMSIGEHLEELRRRLILALVGFVVVFIVCLFFGRQVMAAFCRPLIDVLQQTEVNPQVYFTQVSDPFMVFIQISLVSAAAISGPWALYQLWLFVAAGLYSHERKVITRYIPLSLTLLVSGMLFVYYLILPWTLQFFLAFSINIPLIQEPSPSIAMPSTQPALQIPAIAGNPAQPQDLQMWFDTVQQRLKIFLHGDIRVIPFGPQNLTAPMITLPDYIGLVFGMLLVFGLSFQLPLVVMAVARLGIVDLDTLRRSRKYVYFAMAILASVITPGDTITATIGLMIPLCLLYELGLLLSGRRPA